MELRQLRFPLRAQTLRYDVFVAWRATAASRPQLMPYGRRFSTTPATTTRARTITHQ
jgi:hypothetical protein